MIVILNSKTHVGANPPSDTTKTWISADMTEISIYPEPETYGRLNARIDVKAILLAHNLDIKSDRIRVFSLADDVLEVKRYVNGEWIVVDNPDNYVDIIMNGKVIGTMEVDSIAPGEIVAEWDGTGVVIAPIEPEEPEQLMTFTINGISYTMENRMTWYEWTRSEYNIDGFSCANENDYVYEAESSNKVTDSEGNDVLGTTVIVESGAYLIKGEATTDELAGTWLLNENLSNPTEGKTFYLSGTYYGKYDVDGGDVSSTVSLKRIELRTDWCVVSFYNREDDTPQYSQTYYSADEHKYYMKYQYTSQAAGREELPASSVEVRTFTITSNLAEVENGTELLAWLNANATKQ